MKTFWIVLVATWYCGRVWFWDHVVSLGKRRAEVAEKKESAWLNRHAAYFYAKRMRREV